MRVLIACFLIVAAGLAGCARDATSGVEFTAKDGLRDAEVAAMARHADARLVAVFGTEIGRAMMEEVFANVTIEHEVANASSGPHAAAFARAAPVASTSVSTSASMSASRTMPKEYTDSFPGDGRAPLWTYLFATANGTFAVMVDASGALDLAMAGDEVFPCGMDCPPIGNWTLDSDDAAEVARGVDSYEALRGDPTAAGGYALVSGPDGATWVATLGTMTGRMSVVGVDANTGNLTDASWYVEHLVREAGEVSGNVRIGAPVSWGFDIESAGHDALVVRFDFGGPPVPMQSIDVRVIDPLGNERSDRVTVGLGGVREHTFTFDEVPQGAYTVEVRVAIGVSSSVAMSWCTDGEAIGMDTAACQGLAA